MTGWLDAYAKWLPDALSNGETHSNDAFRAGYLAAVCDSLSAWRDIVSSLVEFAAENARELSEIAKDEDADTAAFYRIAADEAWTAVEAARELLKTSESAGS